MLGKKIDLKVINDSLWQISSGEGAFWKSKYFKLQIFFQLAYKSLFKWN